MPAAGRDVSALVRMLLQRSPVPADVPNDRLNTYSRSPNVPGKTAERLRDPGLAYRRPLQRSCIPASQLVGRTCDRRISAGRALWYQAGPKAPAGPLTQSACSRVSMPVLCRKNLSSSAVVQPAVQPVP